jgi:hypothetical protein
MALTEFQKALTAYLRCLPLSDRRRFLGVLCAEARRLLAPLRAAVDAKTGAVVVIAPPSILLSEEGILAPLLSEEGILAPANRKKPRAAAF